MDQLICRPFPGIPESSRLSFLGHSPLQYTQPGSYSAKDQFETGSDEHLCDSLRFLKRILKTYHFERFFLNMEACFFLHHIKSNHYIYHVYKHYIK